MEYSDLEAGETRPVRYGVEKTEDGGRLTLVMEDGTEAVFRLHMLDMMAIASRMMHICGNRPQ